ncbi:uncharacterized protein LOC6739307 isoform X2 [Drosophila simulans]|uniref:GD15357 n=1 Tax=Drosophila simulans TaxID=7240 RepID=B4NS62_DROSI|nr:uncharacterized protein LOC6739307 isoform X2 [Drosophila simulans]EDX15440.1 GD15357 [Drosophila simulans]KMY92091.1 uncharacterized protein Dsimw501_GD15357, isoform A [Drosophila simulans]
MWKLDSKEGIICSGAASICLAIAYLIIFANLRGLSYNFGVHIASMQIISSAVLIVGATKERHKLFVPWMITTAMFLYLMGYSSIVLLAMGDWVIVMFFAAPVIGCLGMAFYAVQKAFCRMRKDGMPPKYADMQVKSILVNPI